MGNCSSTNRKANCLKGLDIEPIKRLPGPRAIRLLQIPSLESLQTLDDGRIRLEMVVEAFQLDKCPKFTALSYTWGDPIYDLDYNTADNRAETQPNYLPNTADADFSFRSGTGELISKISYGIPRNLLDGIYQICRAGDCTWLWADAICIDQDNNEEKQIQVALMDEIYSEAQKVIVWLGQESPEFVDFRWLHEDFFDALSLYESSHGIEGLQKLDPCQGGLLSYELGVVPPNKSWATCWRNYFLFYGQRRWFSRCWIIQEVTLANDVVFQCGQTQIDLEKLTNLFDIFTKARWQSLLSITLNGQTRHPLGEELIPLIQIREEWIRQLRDLVEEFRPNQEPTNSAPPAHDLVALRERWFHFFQDLLRNTRKHCASDGRDKVYSLIGISRSVMPPIMDYPICPDYSSGSTTQSVFTDTAKMLLQELPRLQHLSFVQDRASTNVMGLPSWVPDYTAKIPVPLVTLNGTKSPFNCSRGTKTTRLVIRGRKMVVPGVCFDHVLEYCPMLTDHVWETYLPLLNTCQRLNESYFDTAEGPGEILQKTLTVNVSQWSLPAIDHRRGFKAWLSLAMARALTRDLDPELSSDSIDDQTISREIGVLQTLHAKERNPENPTLPTVDEIVKMCRVFATGLHSSRPLKTSVEQQTAARTISKDFEMAMAHVIPFRCIYRTSRGYLGIGPASLQKGDEVWMLQSACVPFLLRGVEDGNHTLIGETYLHGYMNSEMEDENKAELSEVSII